MGPIDISKNILLRKYITNKSSSVSIFLSQNFKNSVISSKKFLSLSNQLAYSLVKGYLKDHEVEKEQFKLFEEILHLKGANFFGNDNILDLIRMYRAQTATILSNPVFNQSRNLKVKIESYVPSPKIYRIPTHEKTVSSLSQKVCDLQITKKYYHLFFKKFKFAISNNIVQSHIELRLVSNYFRNLIGAFRERIIMYLKDYIHLFI